MERFCLKFMLVITITLVNIKQQQYNAIEIQMQNELRAFKNCWFGLTFNNVCSFQYFVLNSNYALLWIQLASI